MHRRQKKLRSLGTGMIMWALVSGEGEKGPVKLPP